MRTITGLMEAEVGGDTLNCTLKTWFGRLKTGWAESESTKQRRKRLNKQLARSKLPQTVCVSMTAAREGRSLQASETTPDLGPAIH